MHHLHWDFYSVYARIDQWMVIDIFQIKYVWFIKPPIPLWTSHCSVKYSLPTYPIQKAKAEKGDVMVQCLLFKKKKKCLKVTDNSLNHHLDLNTYDYSHCCWKNVNISLLIQTVQTCWNRDTYLYLLYKIRLWIKSLCSRILILWMK